MRRILEVNLALVRQRRAGFGLDAYTNELTYAFVVPSTVAATPLLATMSDIARQAHEWRKNYYLASRPAATDGVYRFTRPVRVTHRRRRDEDRKLRHRQHSQP